MLGSENYQQNLDPFIRTSKKGVPLELTSIDALISSDSAWIRVIMTVLRLFESIKLPTKFDESSVTQEYKGKPLDPIVKDFKSFLEK